ncbi:uncharacterized protein N0V89_001497 [Didymosphaeria variabile]|uniref:Phenylacetaldoxime dehydratase n=1 Tax=Didymosphaeria variabile TaxID=1932322 RepID=A0A9W8XWP4_9PLEO|nr:uncharacterized protein N0V89_001497 [Didymosphaeria variabile]KAJ4360928.1 hypothetical protein N0V89_001497 [Didymosphaeria variabile]
MACPIPSARTYPLRKPPNHTLPVPRYTITLPSTTTHIHTLYVGLQTHSANPGIAAALKQAQQQIQTWIESSDSVYETLTLLDPTNDESSNSVYETLTLLDPTNDDLPGSQIWVCYWTNSSAPPSSSHPPNLDLQRLWKTLPSSARSSIALWKESFTNPTSRLETNYSGTEYLPGLARLPGTQVREHDLATYWGAARDRIPDSANDLFTRPDGAREDKGVQEEADGTGKVLSGSNSENVVHIRSGQWWANCSPPETAAYEEKLEPTLRAGLAYLNAHRAETGCMGIRYLRNSPSFSSNPSIKSDEEERKETCGAGFFHNLEDLERWSKTHSSHLKIWRGALAHYKAFPEDRRLRTWHEVSVIKEGDARWEYVNCRAGTGLWGVWRWRGRCWRRSIRFGGELFRGESCEGLMQYYQI